MYDTKQSCGHDKAKDAVSREAKDRNNELKEA